MAIHLTRALTCTEGVPGLATGLGLIHGLLERYWDRIYPLLEADHDNDPTERLNALAPLVDPDVMIRHLRDASLVNSREHGQLQARDIEIALGRLTPRSGDRKAARPASRADGRCVRERPLGAVRAARGARAGDGDPGLDRRARRRGPRDRPRAAAGAARLSARGARRRSARGRPERTAPPRRVRVGRTPGAPDGIRSRQDAVQMLELVCKYMERHEPSNPAPLFIRRAQRLIR